MLAVGPLRLAIKTCNAIFFVTVSLIIMRRRGGLIEHMCDVTVLHFRKLI
jgi:hypothetical protein